MLEQLQMQSSVGLFKRLGWIPISNIIELRKLCIMHNIIHGKCPHYFNHYICFVNNRHHCTTRASTNMDLTTPLNTKTGKRSFQASGTKLWNNQDSITRGLIPLCKFRNLLYKKYKDRNSRIDNFTLVEISIEFSIAVFLCIFLFEFVIVVAWQILRITMRTTGFTSNCVIQ